MPQKFSAIFAPPDPAHPVPCTVNDGILPLRRQADVSSRWHTKEIVSNVRPTSGVIDGSTGHRISLLTLPAPPRQCLDRIAPVMRNQLRLSMIAKSRGASFPCCTADIGRKPKTSPAPKAGMKCAFISLDVGWGLRMRNSFRILFLWSGSVLFNASVGTVIVYALKILRLHSIPRHAWVRIQLQRHIPH